MKAKRMALFSKTLKGSDFITVILVTSVFLGLIVYAETISASSERYVAELENKQSILNSIKEDAVSLDIDMKQAAHVISAKRHDLNKMVVNAEDLSMLIPSTTRITPIASPSMCGTLSPEKRAEILGKQLKEDLKK